jgi:hypothetical protein
MELSSEKLDEERIKELREKEGLFMKRIRNQLRIHWGWLKREEDYNLVADYIHLWMRQISASHHCIDKENKDGL